MTRLAILATLAATSGAVGQTTSMDCVPPLHPMTDASPDDVRDFEDLIRAEFSAYFNEAQSYLNCLAAAQTRATEEINEVLEAPRRMFPGG